MFKKTLFVMLSLALVLAACSPAAATPEAMLDKPTEVMLDKPTDAMMNEPTDDMMDKPTDDMMDKPSDAMMLDSTSTPEAMVDDMMDTPAWFGVTLNNVRTGEDFSLNDFTGKVVLVEMLAMWCPNCKKQQVQVKALHDALGMDTGLISVGLDVDPNENAADLKTYTDSNGFDWIYAVAPTDVAREIGNLYGDQFLNPSSTPILVIDRHGEVHPMPFGIKSADDLMKFLDPFLQEGM